MNLINPVSIIRILGLIMLIETVSMLTCVPVALTYNESVWPFMTSVIISGFIAGLMRLPGRNTILNNINNRDTFLVVTLAWVLISVTGSLPYMLSGTIPSFINALFESASGFTTTGASILTEVESLPHSILFWRSLTHWIGGIGIIVLVILILPSLRITGYHLFSLESSVKEKIHPRIKGVVRRIMLIYLGLTVTEIVFLSLGDMKIFDSICHAFGTVATGVSQQKIQALQDIRSIPSM